VREEKRVKICLVETENEVNNEIVDKFSNEKQANFKLFNYVSGFSNPFYYINICAWE
jgi:hypothetical protein|tara:strand:+ start:166 stop:336 length:171 start_codon:yes stop_codon:yes gene_type:complete